MMLKKKTKSLFLIISLFHYSLTLLLSTNIRKIFIQASIILTLSLPVSFFRFFRPFSRNFRPILINLISKLT